jgi:hypothetical protein
LDGPSKNQEVKSMTDRINTGQWPDLVPAYLLAPGGQDYVGDNEYDDPGETEEEDIR